MKKLLFLLPILLICLSLKEYKRPYTIHIIGTGSGNVSVTSMGSLGLSQGDILEVATQTGTYGSLTLNNLINITVIAQTGRPVFTTGGQIVGNTGLSISGIDFNSTNGASIDMTSGRNFSFTFHNMHFSNFPGAVFDCSGNLLYNYGDTTTYKWYHGTFDSISLFQCGLLVQGSYGSPSDNSGHPPDVCREITFSRLTDDATTATFEPGKEVHGIFFHCTAHDWKVTSPGGAANGDVGMLYGWGWWHMWNIYRNGGNGYIARIFPMEEESDQGDIELWNSAKFNTSEYGLENYQYDTSGSINGHFCSTNGNTWNCEAGNFTDQIHYWCPLANNGQVGSNRHYNIHNNFAFNLFLNGKQPIASDLGGWSTLGGDTSHNQYWNSATQAKLDSVTNMIVTSLGAAKQYVITSSTPGAILNGGLTSPFTSTDFFGLAYRTAPDLGYLALPGAPPPPPTPCDCTIRKRRNPGYHTTAQNP